MLEHVLKLEYVSSPAEVSTTIKLNEISTKLNLTWRTMTTLFFSLKGTLEQVSTGPFRMKQEVIISMRKLL